MKTLKWSLVYLAAMVLSGCYTQFAVTRDEPEAVADTEQVDMLQPPPTAIIVEPVYNPEPPPYYALPFVGVPSQGSVVQTPPESPKRDIGNTRSGSGSSSDANTRQIGQDRKAR